MTSQDNSSDPSPKPSADPLIGRVFNERFKVQRLLARGGLSAVYRAEQAPLGRTCALKVLKPRYEGAVQFEFHRRFFLEASIASKLTHPNNVTVFDYGHTDDDVYFMAMEFLEGRTLAQAIRAEAPFTEERILHIARQVCRALREAHSLGVIHRDIKPSNVFLVERADEDDFVKVIDYGLVKDIRASDTGEDITQAGLFMGSPKYVSPEQIQGESVDGRTDIYALGVIMYEMATGRVPFERNSDVHTMIAHVKEEPPPLRTVYPACNISPFLEQIIFKCIAKRPTDRFASTEELLLLLKQGVDAALTATLISESGRLLALSSSGAVAPPETRSGTISGPHVFLAGGATGPSAPIDPALIEQERARALRARRVRSLVAGGVLLGALAATAAIVGLRSRPADALSASDDSAAARAGAEPAMSPPQHIASLDVSPSAAPTPSSTARKVRVETEPSGAAVRLSDARGQQLCVSTPCDVTLGQGDAGDSVRLYLTRRGFTPTTRDLGRTDDVLSVRLVPVAVSVPAKTGTATTATGVGPYKFDPY